MDPEEAKVKGLVPATGGAAEGGYLMPGAKPGEIRNPKGRRTMGAYISECLNSLACQQPSREKLRSMLKGEDISSNMRIAAIRYLRMMEHPDITDFEAALDGQKSLTKLRADGVDTAVVKKVKTKTRTSHNNAEGKVTEVEREIELYDRSGEEFDRVLDRTDGKPMQSIGGPEGGPLEVTVKVLRGVSMDDI